jgi:hypothetical protein
MRTYVPRGREAEALKVGKDWFVIDAEGVVLGRLATRVASLLIGKDKPTYTPHLDCGDHVVVVNAEKIKLTGNKIDQKLYRRHSGCGKNRSAGCCSAGRKKYCGKRCLECCRRTSSVREEQRSCVFMPEVKASPATPDKSLSHSRYSLAIDILKFSVLRRNPSGP